MKRASRRMKRLPAAAGHCRCYPINRISPLHTLAKYTAGFTMFLFPLAAAIT